MALSHLQRVSVRGNFVFPLVDNGGSSSLTRDCLCRWHFAIPVHEGATCKERCKRLIWGRTVHCEADLLPPLLHSRRPEIKLAFLGAAGKLCTLIPALHIVRKTSKVLTTSHNHNFALHWPRYIVCTPIRQFATSQPWICGGQ